MRRWRVGSFSLGLVFIITGVAAAFEWWAPSTSGFFTAAKTWPAVLVILGLEIVVATYLQGGSDAKIVYDWLGIFAILIIVCGSLVLEAANVTGLLEEARYSVHASAWTNLDSPIFPIPVQTGVVRAAIVCDVGDVEVRTTSSRGITVQASGTVTAESSTDATAWIHGFDAVSYKEGDTVFISLKSPPREQRMGRTQSSAKWLVTVPNALHLDFSAPSRVDVVARGLNADWVIDAAIGRIQVTLSKDDNLDILARTRSYADVGGNIEWAFWSDNPETEEYPDSWVTRVAQAGEGGHSLLLRGSQGIFVDTP